MTDWNRLITHICILILIVGYQNLDAQQQLPYGAKARFGMNKGAISDVVFAPDGTRLAIASNVGIWLYEAATGKETALAPATPFDISAIAFHPMVKRLRVGVLIRQLAYGVRRRASSVAVSVDTRVLST